MTDQELLALHRDIVAIPSVSGDEAALCEHMLRLLAARGVEVERVGDNLLAACGRGPVLCLNSHLDTVPPTSAWTRSPHAVEVVGGRVHGLGSNDAKASVAAMTAAFLRLHERRGAPGARLLLALTAREETGGGGAEILVEELDRRGLRPGAVVVGEPTGLDVAVAQKGLLVLELRATGGACHAAHRRALGTPNAIVALARDLVALQNADLGPEDPLLGPVTVEPTIAQAGAARNMVPAEASAILDVRTNPEPGPRAIVEHLRAIVAGELKVLSERLRPCAIAVDHPLAKAALESRPRARAIGSRGVSDLVFFRGIPGIKAGPGETQRSHVPDEFVLESEIIEGAGFYESLALRARDFLAPVAP
jgi:acetylornithine deacetylase